MFVKNNGLFDEMVRLQDIRSFLYTSHLFGDCLTCTRQNAIAVAISTCMENTGETLSSGREPSLYLIKSGKVDLFLGERVIDSLSPGDFFNESSLLFDTPSLFKARPDKNSVVYNIPGAVLADIPIVRWKLLETYEKRLNKAVCNEHDDSPFQWQEEYSVNVAVIDEQHRELYAIAKLLYAALFDVVPTTPATRCTPRSMSRSSVRCAISPACTRPSTRPPRKRSASSSRTGC